MRQMYSVRIRKELETLPKKTEMLWRQAKRKSPVSQESMQKKKKKMTEEISWEHPSDTE